MAPRRPGPRAHDPFSAYLGLRWDDAATVGLAVRPDLVNSVGLLLGPVGFALVDYGMASALYEATGPDELMATTSITINYIRSVREGEVVCRTRLEHRNARQGILSSQVSDGRGRVLAIATGAFAIFPASVLDPLAPPISA